MKKLSKEFREFIARGNVLDMAIGVIIAAAFGKTNTSLVNDLLMPLISWIFGTRDMTALNILVREAETDAAGTVVREAITLGFGSFICTVNDFLLIALFVFFIMKAFNKARKKKEETPAPDPGPTSEELLAKILDEIKRK